jgi:HD-GYP domain-containing protein (c-di-GMP phosphodiesterase class II)
MSSIYDVIAEKNYINEIIFYLETFHDVCAVVMDGNGNATARERVPAEYQEQEYYPFSFPDNIGGIRCHAESASVLEKAAPHILMAVKSLQMLSEKEIVLQQTMDEMLQLSEQLYFLSGLSAKLSGIQDIEAYCRVVIQEISGTIAADAAFTCMKNGNSGTTIVTHNIPVEEVEAIYDAVVDTVVSDNRTVIFRQTDGTSVMAVPMEEKERPAGYGVFIKKAGSRSFSSYDKQFVSIINNIVSPTMESLSLYNRLHVLYLNTVKALAAAIDTKDAYTHGHSFRVAKYSVAIGRNLGVAAADLSDLEVAGYMHDLGKIGIPEAILGKRGRLTGEEFEEIKKHPELTNKILEPINLPESVVKATMQHHERLDGLGYPLGLKGDDISHFARIIAVADVFDALTSARPYRDAMTVEDALMTLCEGIDHEFDRDVVNAFVDALRDTSSDSDLTDVCSEISSITVNRITTEAMERRHLCRSVPPAF